MLNLLLVTLGLAWLTEVAGLSLALGAFIAGMLVAETEYKHQVETDIRPFHDVLLGLFFITIGMRLDWRPLVDQWLLVLLLTTLPVLAKAVLVALLARAFGATPGAAIRTGLYLAQAGEFGFVLLALGVGNHLLVGDWMNPVWAAMVLSMLATPFMVMWSSRIVMRLSSSDWMMQSVQLTAIAKKAMRTEAHVIICGYGRSGQNLARLLEREGIAYMALDLDPDRVRQAAAAGQSVVFGDAARLRSLMAAGLVRASAVVVSYPDTASALKILHLVHEHAPRVPVIVRTIDDSDLEKLREAGAAEVVPEAMEGSLMLAAQALALVGVPMQRVIRITRDARDARYGLLRGYFHGADDDTVQELQQARLASVTLAAGCRLPRASAVGAGAARHRRAGGVAAAGLGPRAGARRQPRAGCRRHAGAVRAAGGAGAGRGEAAARVSAAARARCSLADAKAPEDLAQQVVRGEGAGDLAQALVRQPQLLGQQLERGVALRDVAACQRQVLSRPPQGVHMARAGDEAAFGCRLPARELEQRAAQRVQALAGERRQHDGVVFARHRAPRGRTC